MSCQLDTKAMKSYTRINECLICVAFLLLKNKERLVRIKMSYLFSTTFLIYYYLLHQQNFKSKRRQIKLSQSIRKRTNDSDQITVIQITTTTITLLLITGFDGLNHQLSSFFNIHGFEHTLICWVYANVIHAGLVFSLIIPYSGIISDDVTKPLASF